MTSQAIRALPSKYRWVRAGAAIGLAWSVVALLLATQGYLTSGGRQAWWPSLGYSAAIFSVWAALTGPILMAVRAIEGRGPGPVQRAVIYAAGVLVVSALHVGLFVLIYWPLYNDGGRIPTRWAMGEMMFVRNLGTNVIFYAAIVAAVLLLARRARRPAQAPPEVLRARGRGVVRLVPLEQVDWIEAAGNYAQAHTTAGAVLVDESLASLAARLPGERFGRIHRRAIVRLDRIVEVRSLGRGDAEVVLGSGRALRLSRRYRDALSTLLKGR